MPLPVLLALAGCSGSVLGRSCGSGPRCAGAGAACWAEGQERLRRADVDLAGAAARFDEACDDGYLPACVDLALLVQDGRGAERDPERAVALYRRACDGGLGVGCSNLGLMYESGTGGVPMDRELADEAFRAALAAYRASCSGPTPEYCANLGWMLEVGRGGPPHPEEALAAWARGCAGGDVDACVNRLTHALEVGTDVAASVAELRTLCGGDAPTACGPLARALAPTEPDAATDFARSGCDRGDPDACSVLAVLLGAGPDPSAAAPAWERACRLGRAEGCAHVAEQQMGARGDPAAKSQLVEHLDLGCRIGDVRACVRLARGFLGDELGPDSERAFAAWSEACRLAWPDACVELVKAGRPLPLSDRVRIRFLADSCERGIVEACSDR